MKLINWNMKSDTQEYYRYVHGRNNFSSCCGSSWQSTATVKTKLDTAAKGLRLIGMKAGEETPEDSPVQLKHIKTKNGTITAIFKPGSED